MKNDNDNIFLFWSNEKWQWQFFILIEGKMTMAKFFTFRSEEKQSPTRKNIIEKYSSIISSPIQIKLFFWLEYKFKIKQTLIVRKQSQNKKKHQPSLRCSSGTRSRIVMRRLPHGRSCLGHHLCDGTKNGTPFYMSGTHRKRHEDENIWTYSRLPISADRQTCPRPWPSCRVSSPWPSWPSYPSPKRRKKRNDKRKEGRRENRIKRTVLDRPASRPDCVWPSRSECSLTIPTC